MYIKPKSEFSPPAKGLWYVMNKSFTWPKKVIGFRVCTLGKKSELSPPINGLWYVVNSSLYGDV